MVIEAQKIIQQFLNIPDPEQINLISMGNLPFNLYWKDNKGKYLGCNDTMMRDIGLTKSTDIIGLTDYDMVWSEDASLLHEHDNLVRAKEQPMSFLERGFIKSGEYCRFVSLKAPLRSKQGIVGLSFILYKNEAFQSHFPTLSEQQSKCLYHLTKGLSIKKIGQSLDLSPKTVENYLNAVKTKLGCNSRSELIAYAIKCGALII